MIRGMINNFFDRQPKDFQTPIVRREIDFFGVVGYAIMADTARKI